MPTLRPIAERKAYVGYYYGHKAKFALRTSLITDVRFGTLQTPWLYLETNPILPNGLPTYINATLLRSIWAVPLAEVHADIFDGIHADSYFFVSNGNK